MARVKAFFVLLALSSVCFGATLMQLSVASASPQERSAKVDKTCQALLKEHQATSNLKAADEMYRQAYVLTFNGDLKKAQEASTCASQLLNGTDHWRFEVRDLVH